MASKVSEVRFASYGGPTGASVSGGGAWFDCADVGQPSVPIVPPLSTGTAFSFVRHLKMYVWDGTAPVSLTGIRFSKGRNEITTGTKLWYVVTNTYVQSTSAPAATSDNNITAPVINGVTASAVPLYPSSFLYDAGPLTVSSIPAAPSANYIDMVLGVDATAPATYVPSGFVWVLENTDIVWEWDEG